MFNVSVRKVVVSAIAIAAPVALSFGASTEAWGGKTSAWDSRPSTHAGKTSAWDAHHVNLARTSAWDARTSAWD